VGDLPEPTEGVVAKTSQAVPCRESYDEEHFWPPDTGAPPGTIGTEILAT
jgi:hypothetical protein